VLGLGGDDPQRLGPYRLRAVIGDGGMGRVYLATSPAGRAVAVKVIGRGLANQPGYRERFAREARAAMSVSGLYTASVVDADTTGESPYIATEYVPAPSLAESVVKTGPLPASAVFALAGGLAEALVAIHRAGLVHRDVKPHNILLAADGPVVIDFGIAVGDETSLTAVGMTVGTPGYIAPEVLHGKDPSARSDVFSLGCVLVYAARGTGPFGTGDPLAIAHRSATGEPDLTGVPDNVKALVTPMLQRDPARRPTPEQLLQHVSLSSSAVLHDGLWLPDGVRGLLSQRKQELQQALGGPAAAPAQSAAGPPAPPSPSAQPPYRQPIAYTPTPPSDFAALHGMPAPAPAVSRDRKGFLALVGVGGALVMAGAITAVLLVDRGGNSSQNTGSGGTGSVSVTHTTSANAIEATTSASSTSGSSSSANGGSTSYKPGTYTVDQQLAADLFDNTVTLSSITVNGDGTVSAKISFTAAIDGEWTCSGAKAGETAMEAGDKVLDYSTGSDCTKNSTKTWEMTIGETVSESEYFTSAPTGGGTWSFAIDSGVDGTTEFAGSVTGISIPTQ
jgi:serine/threonine protein kinase